MLHEPSLLTKKAPKQSILSVWMLVFLYSGTFHPQKLNLLSRLRMILYQARHRGFQYVGYLEMELIFHHIPQWCLKVMGDTAHKAHGWHFLA